MRPLMPPVQTPDNLFHDGNPLTGELGTIVDAEHLNNVQGAVRDAQSELITVLNAAGINVDPSKQNQLLTALKALLLSRSNPFGDIKSDDTVKTALENLGLGLGSALPVGVPVPWPLTTPPTGWMKCKGSRFSLTGYPALAAVFPSGVLPDLRGEFIRGWDDGRGVDAGRAIMTTQEDAIQNITGEVGFIQYFGETHHSGALFPGGAQNITNVDPGGDTGAQSVFFDASRSVRTASENRPRNIAFNYIVRAA